jgi:hypothetical protein
MTMKPGAWFALAALGVAVWAIVLFVHDRPPVRDRPGVAAAAADDTRAIVQTIRGSETPEQARAALQASNSAAGRLMDQVAQIVTDNRAESERIFAAFGFQLPPDLFSADTLANAAVVERVLAGLQGTISRFSSARAQIDALYDRRRARIEAAVAASSVSDDLKRDMIASARLNASHEIDFWARRIDLDRRSLEEVRDVLQFVLSQPGGVRADAQNRIAFATAQASQEYNARMARIRALDGEYGQLERDRAAQLERGRAVLRGVQ